jgi:hypothetical protein
MSHQTTQSGVISKNYLSPTAGGIVKNKKPPYPNWFSPGMTVFNTILRTRGGL